jgi:NADH-quinone oxidoreductase subunit L
MSMKIPLILLAILSAVTGFIPFSEFVTTDGIPFTSHIHWDIAIPATIVGALGIIIAFIFYKKESDLSDKAVASFGGFYRTVYEKFYIDELYIFVTKKSYSI